MGTLYTQATKGVLSARLMICSDGIGVFRSRPWDLLSLLASSHGRAGRIRGRSYKLGVVTPLVGEGVEELIGPNTRLDLKGGPSQAAVFRPVLKGVHVCCIVPAWPPSWRLTSSRAQRAVSMVRGWKSRFDLVCLIMVVSQSWRKASTSSPLG